MRRSFAHLLGGFTSEIQDVVHPFPNCFSVVSDEPVIKGGSSTF